MEQDNIMYFNTDDEFTNWCLDYNPTIHNSTIIDNAQYYDYSFTQEYLDALNNGMQFVINDPNSKVRKRNCVCRGLISKPVQNICQSY